MVLSVPQYSEKQASVSERSFSWSDVIGHEGMNIQTQDHSERSFSWSDVIGHEGMHIQTQAHSERSFSWSDVIGHTGMHIQTQDHSDSAHYPKSEMNSQTMVYSAGNK